MLHQLYIEYIKGMRRSFQLKKLNILQGPNGSGKTTVLQSIMLAMLSYIPGIGKRNEDIYQLCSNKERGMKVSFNSSNIQFDRSFKKNKTGVSQDIRIVGEPSGIGVNEAQGIIQAKVGNFPLMFDLNEFLSMSDNKKLEYIFGLSSIAGGATWSENDTVDKIVITALDKILGEGMLQGMLLGKYEKESVDELNKEDKQKYIEELIGKSSQHENIHKIIDSISCLNAGNVNNYLIQAIDRVKELEKQARAKASSARAANKSLAAEKEKYQGSSSGIPELKAEIEKMEASIIGLEKEKSTQIEKLKGYKLGERRISQIDEEIKVIQETEYTDEDIKKEKEGLNNLLEKKKELETRIKDLPEWQKRRNDLVEKFQELSVKRVKMLATAKSIKDLINDLEGAKENRRCPLTSEIECRTDFSMLMESKKKELKSLDKKEKKAEKEIEVMDNQTISYNGTIADLEQKVSELKEVEIYILNHEENIQRMESSGERKTIKTKRLELEKLEIQAELDKERFVDTDDLDMQLTGLKKALLDKKEELEREEQRKAIMLSMTNSLISVKKAEEEWQTAKTFSFALRMVRDEIVSKSIQPIEKIVNELLEKIDPKYNLVFDKEIGKCDFGWQKKGVGYVPFNALSGGESVLFSIGLITALIIQKNPELKILLIEMGEVDKTNAVKLLSGLEVLSQHLDNVLIASCHSIKASAEWNVLDMEKVQEPELVGKTDI